MAVVANLAVALTARTSQFNSGMRTSQSTIKQFGASISNAGKRIAAFGAALATGAAVAGIAAFKASLEELDTLAKAARRLDITPQALREFEHAARLAGVENDKLVKGLERMSINIGEAAQGIGEAKDSIERLGLSATELRDKGPAVAFVEVLRALEKVPNQIDKVSIASDIFGARVLSLLNLTSSGIEQSRDFFERFKISISETDTSNIERVNDRFADIKEVLVGVRNEISAGLAPLVERMQESFLAWAEAAGGAEAASTSFINSITPGLQKIADIAHDIGTAYHGIATVAKGVTTAVTGAAAIAVGAIEAPLEALGIGESGISKTLGLATVDLAKRTADSARAFNRSFTGRAPRIPDIVSLARNGGESEAQRQPGPDLSPEAVEHDREMLVSLRQIARNTERLERISSARTPGQLAAAFF